MRRLSASTKFFSLPVVMLNLILLVQWGLFVGTTLHPYMVNPPNRSYNFLRGHLIYSSMIRQSEDGAWSLIVPHTTRPVQSTHTPMFFIVLGKIAAFLTLPAPIMYMASRVAAAVILFWATYWLITIIFPKSLHLLAILFILAIEPGPLITTMLKNPSTWTPSIFSYYPQIVAYRHFGLPHHTMGEAIGLLFLGSFILAVRKPSVKRYVMVGALALIGSLTLPSYFFIAMCAVIAPWCLYALIKKTLKPMIAPTIISGLAVGAVLLFMKYEFTKVGYPSKDFNLDEKRWVTNSDILINYVSTILLYIPFVAFLWAGLIKFWHHFDSGTKEIVLIMSSWMLIPPILVFVSSYPWFPLANFRLMDGYNYVPMGILATLGLHELTKTIRKKALGSFIQGFLVMGLLIASGFLTYTYTHQVITEQNDIWTNVYPSRDAWKAFAFLNTVPKGSGIMVMNHTGETIPEFANVRSFLGSTPGFVDWGERYWIAQSFYSGQMGDEEARITLKREDITYVYYGADEETSYNKTGTLYPNVLTPVFELPSVTIYAIKPE